MMRKATLVSVAVAAIVGGYFAGRYYKNRGQDSATVAAGAAAAPDGVDRRRVALAGNAKGADAALVNIVEFSDFQCPFCGRVNPQLERVMKDYAGKVRLYFRHFPLSFHADAPLASQAALAAGAQGKFWPMHDKLFANQEHLAPVDLEKYAKELKLDVAKWKADLASAKERVEKEHQEGEKNDLTGTPTLYINGRRYAGPLRYEEIKDWIDEELNK